MSGKSWAIDIDRDDITQAILVSDPDTPLAPGQVRVRIDSYAMTANNITYAVFGKPAGLFAGRTCPAWSPRCVREPLGAGAGDGISQAGGAHAAG